MCEAKKTDVVSSVGAGDSFSASFLSKYLKGYQAHGMLSNDNIVTVPDDKYFMLGDNSCNSYDSRFWGFAPKRSIRGFPLLIFYPMSDRIGPCK